MNALQRNCASLIRYLSLTLKNTKTISNEKDFDSGLIGARQCVGRGKGLSWTRNSYLFTLGATVIS